MIEELRETAEHQDVHGKAAEKVLGLSDSIVVHQIEKRGVQSSRIDEGEGSCATLTREGDVDFLLTSSPA